MKTKHLYISVLLISASLLIIGAKLESKHSYGIKQADNKEIIKFSHSFHLAMSDCQMCHSGAAESTSLNDRLLPTKPDCANCHDVDDDCEVCHYEDVYEPLVQEKPELYFNHGQHIDGLDLECTECHKGLDEVDYSSEAAESLPPMDVCYECHNNTTVAVNYCESCHISTANLLPEDHKENSFKDDHKFLVEDADANCSMCHGDDFCGSCHEATLQITEMNTADDFYTPYEIDTYLDGVKQQKINRVHDMTYRYDHGIDARGKTSDCQSCHDLQLFCAECHSAGGGDYAMSGITPVSHFTPGFVTIGVGSGGGEHAVLAKRDIESCAACHDTYGADPNCVLCHSDPDGIKGTNPKTHSKALDGFSTEGEGSFHSDMGAVCYNCHTDANASPNGIAGTGFCGYCHQ